jgi:hypothetical protein
MQLHRPALIGQHRLQIGVPRQQKLHIGRLHQVRAPLRCVGPPQQCQRRMRVVAPLRVLADHRQGRGRLRDHLHRAVAHRVAVKPGLGQRGRVPRAPRHAARAAPDGHARPGRGLLLRSAGLPFEDSSTPCASLLKVRRNARTAGSQGANSRDAAGPRRAAAARPSPPRPARRPGPGCPARRSPWRVIRHISSSSSASTPQMRHAPLFVERGDGLGPRRLAPRRPHRHVVDQRIDLPHHDLHQLAALVDLRHQPVSAVVVIGPRRRPRPGPGAGRPTLQSAITTARHVPRRPLRHHRSPPRSRRRPTRHAPSPAGPPPR